MTASLTDKFTLDAGPCAAKGYPMTIQVGNFMGPGGDRFPVPSGHHLDGKWGLSSRSWAVGEETHPAPDHLEILYFSYTEDVFYEGHFALPTAKIHALLTEGFWDLEAQKKVTYNKLTVCVLPKGTVVVWLTGPGKQVLVGRFQAGASTADFREYYPASDRAEMFRETCAELPPAVQAQVKAGTISDRQWTEYLVQYPWQVAFGQPLKMTEYNIGFLSGEYTAFPVTADRTPYLAYLLTAALKPVPQRWSVHVTDAAGHRFVLRVDAFDEAETQAAFRALHRADPAGPVTLLVEADKYLKKATLVLKNASQQIPLAKSPVRIIVAD